MCSLLELAANAGALSVVVCCQTLRLTKIKMEKLLLACRKGTQEAQGRSTEQGDVDYLISNELRGTSVHPSPRVVCLIQE